jgi:O-antigen ligase
MAVTELGATAAPVGSFPFVHQEPLRLGLGLVALAFYLWIIHSYKLPAGDIAVAGLAVGVLLRGGEIRLPAPLIFFGLLILWGCLGLGVTESTQRTSDALIAFGKLWIIVFCILNVVRTASEFRFLVITWLALFALYPVRGALYNQYICHCNTLGRVAWNFVFANSNDLAALTLFPLGLAAGVATVERVKFFRLSALIGVGLLSLIILLTQSRGAIIGLGAALLILPLTSRRKGRDVAVLSLLLVIAAIFAPAAVWKRMAGLSNVSVEGDMAAVDAEGSAKSRWQIWEVAGRTIRDNPVIGVGADMMSVRHSQEANRLGLHEKGERDTHSTYLRIGAEMGIPGLILYLLMWGAVFRRVRQVRKAIAQTRPREQQFLFYLELAMFAYMVASIFATLGAITFTYLMMCVAWLAAEILAREPWYVSPAAALQVPAMAHRRR